MLFWAIIKELYLARINLLFQLDFIKKVMEIQKLKTQVIHQQQLYMNGVCRNWVDQETWEFIRGLTFDGFILAGNSVANMIQKIPLQGDLDFWVQDYQKYINVMDEMIPYYETIAIYPSMIEMTNQKGNLPKINLIYANLSPERTIQRFDFDYCRCYWTPVAGVHCIEGCMRSIQTKIIRQPNIIQRVIRKRILKAIKYGYIFQEDFWQHFPDLIKNRNAVVQIDQRERGRWIRNGKPHVIGLQDLKLKKFELKQILIQVTDPYDIQHSLQEITQQYSAISEQQNVKLPVLLTLRGQQKIDILHQYIHSIVLQNPLSDTQYLQVKIGLNAISCQGRRTYQRRRFSSGSSSQTLSSEQQQIVQPQKKYQIQIEISFKDKNSSIKANQEETTDFHDIKGCSTRTILHCGKKDTRFINLNEDGTAYIRIDYLPQHLSQLGMDTFKQMYALHPQKRHKIIMYQKEVQVSRFSQSYLYTPTNLDHTKTRSYMYSGYDTSSNNSELPKLFTPFYEYIRNLQTKYNQVIANWYQDQNDYIAPHSDCQKGMTQEKKVAILSLYPNRNPQNIRKLIITPKSYKSTEAQKFIISLDHGTIITMGGKTQQQFKHGVPKQNRKCSERISLSFRQMSQQ